MKRSGALPKRRAKPRRTTSPRCSRQRCNRRAEALELCHSHLEAEADRVFSLHVRARDGRCVFADVLPELRCAGYLQACHLWSRGNHAIRYHEQNVHAGCKAHHYFIDSHDAAKTDAGEALIGARTLAALRRKAATHERPDLVAIIERYRAPDPR